MNGYTAQPIMIVEDSDDDFEATERALKYEGALYNPIIRFSEGQSAVNYVQNQKTTRPGIILLDLNMPGMDGREVLKRIKSDKSTNDIPIIILTTSDEERDVDTCYRMGANTYIKKPVKMDNFIEAIQRMKTYWLQVALLPREAPASDARKEAS